MASDKQARRDDHAPAKKMGMLRPEVGDSPPAELAAEPSRENTGPSCGVSGHVDVEAFRWDGERHFNWLCHACGRTWTTQNAGPEPK